MAGKILIIEDDPAISRSLRRLLAHEGYYVAETPTAEEAAAVMERDPTFDLLLLDVTLPGADGYEYCQQLRSQGWRQPVIMLTGRAAPRDRVTGLNLGADDYITKPFDPSELLARVSAQLRRSRDYSAPGDVSTQIHIGPDLVVDARLRDAVVRGSAVHLTGREYELLSLMARHPNTPLKKTWLFQQVWGCASELGIKLLAVTVRRLRIKIEDDPDNPSYILTVRGYGYKLASPTDISE